VLLPRLLFIVTAFTSHLELAANYFELKWLRIFPESLYIASAQTRIENATSIVETYLPVIA
jgi:hypothetical protein